LETVEEILVFYLEQGQVAVMADETDFGQVGARILITVDENLLSPADHVCIGHDTFAAHYKARARGRTHHVGAPRHVPIGLLSESGDVNDRFLRLRSGPSCRYCQE